MFEFKEEKLIKDSVHGYIRVPKVFIDNIIDTVEFQRLRNISQTGMKFLYPSATHDRFSHSIGVFHIGNLAVNALLKNFESNPHWNIRSDNTLYVFWATNKVLFLLACLLHDIGHSPFSHALEGFYNPQKGEGMNFVFENTDDSSQPKKSSGTKPIDTKAIPAWENIIKTVTTALINSDKYNTDESINNELIIEKAVLKCAPHEIMSAYLVIAEKPPWRQHIIEVFNRLEKEKYPDIPFLSTGEYDKDDQNVNSQEIENALAFIARMILGIKYENYEPEFQVRNCFVELLNGSIDVDKLDYIIRDTKSSGISNITIDIDRLINSLTIIPSTVYIKEYFDIKAERGVILQNIETDSDSSFELQGKLDRAIELKSYEKSDEKQEGNTDKDSANKFKITFSEGTILTLKQNETENDFLKYGRGEFSSGSVKQGVSHFSVSDSNPTISINVPAKIEFLELLDCRISSNSFTIESNEKSYGILSVDSLLSTGFSTFNGKFTFESNVMLTGQIKGSVKRLTVLGDLLTDKKIPPTQNCYTSFALGYKKPSMNILSNVADARNYLYLWIYADHKVVYYANFLIKELVSKAVNDIFRVGLSSFMLETLDSKKAFLLDDNYMLTQIRSAYEKKDDVDTIVPKQFAKLCDEFYSRKYHKSLYKTLAEFELIFDKYNEKQKPTDDRRIKKLKGYLDKISEYSLAKKTLQYGGIPAEQFDGAEIEHNGKKIKLSEFVEDIIWVDPQALIKGLKPHNILISFNGTETISTMDRLQILNNEKNSNLAESYFYIYYKLKENCSSEDAKKAPEHIKEILIKYFDEKLKDDSENKL
jgi:HD superfamily phosphohydrolase